MTEDVSSAVMIFTLLPPSKSRSSSVPPWRTLRILPPVAALFVFNGAAFTFMVEPSSKVSASRPSACAVPLTVLATVADRFPTCATILYNLACYAAQLGHLDSARARLTEAIKLEPVCREMALVDPDLALLHGELSA